MIFLGENCFRDKTSGESTPIDTDDITFVKLQKAIFDDMYITQNPDYPTTGIFDWDFDTIMHADFDGDLVAGNVDFLLQHVSSMRVKRKRPEDTQWITIFEVETKELDDFQFERFDRYVANRQVYEYALVPVISGMEGNFNVNKITAEFYGVFIVGPEKIFSSALQFESSIQQNSMNSTINTLGSKYPYGIRHSLNNYTSGSLTSFYMQVDNDEDCNMDVPASFQYRKDLLKFLADGFPKMLKMPDEGRMWIVFVTGSPTETQEVSTYKFNTSFDWVEVGDPHNVDDLYHNGFLSEELWLLR